MNKITELYRERPEAASFADGYLDYVREVLARLDRAAIAAFVEVLFAARERNARVFFCGNGGSAATASHFANDIAIGSRSWRKPFRAVSLTDNQAVLTALANDYGFEHVFTRQLETQMQPGDVVVAISASGNSPNVVSAIEHANENGAVSVALTGFDGGRLAEIAQLLVHVPTSEGEYGPAEDAHMVIDHLVGAFLIEACASKAGAAAAEEPAAG